MVLAHAFGTRYELPIPLALFVVGGAVVVLASFALIARREVGTADPPAEDLTPVRGLHPVGAVVSLVGLVLAIVVGLLGSQDVAENILPTTFWLYAWIVVPLACGIVGDWTQQLNPFAALAKVADSERLRRLAIGSSESLAWPRRLGWWPAVILYFALASGELIYNIWATTPKNIALGLILYALINFVMGLLFGRAWLERGEVFTVLYSTWGRLGYYRFGAPGRRGFAGGLAVPFEPVLSRVAFVSLLLISVNFDGLLATPSWLRFERHFPSVVADPHKLEWFRLGTFVLLAAIVLVAFGVFATAAARVGEMSAEPRRALSVLLPSMVPIAFGYLIAHNLEYVLVNGQLIFPLIGNPVGKEGWPIHLPYPFNDDYEPGAHRLLPSSGYWYIAVAVIVLVHVAAVLIAHRHLGHRARTARIARRSEYPWLAAMVGYTMLSLWLVAQPLVKEKSSTPSGEEAFGHRSHQATTSAVT